MKASAPSFGGASLPNKSSLRLEQPSKALLPTDFRPEGKDTLSRFLQPENARSPMEDTFAGISDRARFSQLKNV